MLLQKGMTAVSQSETGAQDGRGYGDMGPHCSLPEAQRWEAVGRLVGGVAHEFNNLLTTILIYSDLLSEEAGAQRRLRLLAREIRVAGGRGASLTRHLLAWSRPRAETAAPLSLGALALSMQPLLQHLAGDGVALTLRPAEGAGRIVLGMGEAQQVLLNLVANARDAMPAGGRLRIEVFRCDVRAGDPPPAALADRRKENRGQEHTLAPGGYVVLRVTDTGCGMSPERRARIFEPFFTTKGGRGTGLGLSAVWDIVQRSQGRIAVHSVPGKGTTMSLFWPRAQGAEAPPAAPPAGRRPVLEGAPRGSGESVLLVEENEDLRRSLRRVLRHLGYRVLTAGDAASGLSRGQSRRAALDLLLVGVRKRGLSASALAARLRARHPRMEVIYMCNSTASRGRRSAGGERMLLRKPFPGSVLARKLREALGDRPAA